MATMSTAVFSFSVGRPSATDVNATAGKTFQWLHYDDVAYIFSPLTWSPAQ